MSSLAVSRICFTGYSLLRFDHLTVALLAAALRDLAGRPGSATAGEVVKIYGSTNVRAQIVRHRVLVMWVLLSQAAMHSGMSLPVAPSGVAVPPPLAMTSPAPPLTMALVGAWGIAPLTAVWLPGEFGGAESCDPLVVVVSPLIGLLAAVAAKSCAPGLN